MIVLSVDHITIDSGCHAPNSRRDGCSGSKLATCVGSYLISKAEHHSGQCGSYFLLKNMPFSLTSGAGPLLHLN